MASVKNDPAIDLNVRRWTVRMIGYALIIFASSAWLVRDVKPFLPAFTVQALAGFAFSLLILAAIVFGVMVGTFVGRLHWLPGLIIGIVAGAAAFFFVGLLSTEIPVIGPAIERVVALIG